MNQPPLNPDALEAASREVFREVLGFTKTQSARVARRAVSAYLAVALPEVTSIEELEALPVGAVVYASNHIGPAEKFVVGWMGCGNNAAWSSALLARDGLPARVLYRPSEQP